MMMDDDLWWWEFNIFQDIKYDQIRNKYEKHTWTVLIHPHLIVIGKKRQDPHQRQNKVDILRGPQFALTRYTKITKITKDKQNTIKLLHSAWFNDTWLNYMDPWLSPYVTMVHLSRAPSHRNRHVKHRRERVPPESICRLHSGTGGIFLSTSVHAAVQFNFLRCSRPGKKRSTARMVKVILWLPVMPCGSNQLIFSTHSVLN